MHVILINISSFIRGCVPTGVKKYLKVRCPLKAYNYICILMRTVRTLAGEARGDLLQGQVPQLRRFENVGEVT